VHRESNAHSVAPRKSREHEMPGDKPDMTLMNRTPVGARLARESILAGTRLVRDWEVSRGDVARGARSYKKTRRWAGFCWQL
jgi:hypothetical protein